MVTSITNPVAARGRTWCALWRPVKALTLVALVTSAGVAEALVPSGTPIDDAASMTFSVGTSTTSMRVSSNSVRAIVATQEGATLTAAANAKATQGEFAVPAVLTNTSNAPETFYVRVTASTGSFAQNLQIVVDNNGNGIADAGEPVVTSTTPITLAPGASVNLLMTGTVPAGTSGAATTTLTLTAQSQDQTITRSASTVVAASGPATIVVTSTATPASPVQGGTLTLAFNASTSDTPVAGSTETVDGAPQSLILLRVPLPAQTVPLSVNSPSGATPLYHRKGDGPDTYYSTPGPLANVDGFAFGVATLAPAQPLIANVVLQVAGFAVGPIAASGALSFVDSSGARTVAAPPLTIALPVLQAQLGIYGTTAYDRTIPSIVYGMPLYLQLTAPACATDPTRATSLVVRLDSKLTGDYEFVAVSETAPGSGVFRTVSPIKAYPAIPDANAPHNDGVIAVADHDTVTATAVGCGSNAASASALVDPAGVVFDSRSGTLVAGAVVTLIDVSGNGNGGQAGQPAVIYAYDGVTRAPSTVTTGTDGAYRFPLVMASTYRLVVQPPAGYTGPSQVAATSLAKGFTIDPSGSYGGTFVVQNELVTLDYPVDAAPISGLFVEKVASKSIADIGDFVDYSVTVRDTSTVAIANVVVHDRLPRGFAYQPGTTRINGAKVVDPVVGPTLDFNAGTLAANGQAVITYRLKIGPGAQGGDGVNHANATAGLSQSNTASVKVLLSDGGVFSDRGYLLGKVFADCNGNGVQDPGERGIPDVRIVLEDGTSAITDEDGKYSLYGLLPRTHVAKVDATTMIEGTTLEAISSRNAGDGNSRFVDLENGELQRADFAVAGCGPELERAIDERRGRTQRLGEAGAAAKALLSPNRITTSDVRTLPSSGVLDAGGLLNRTTLTGDAPAYPPSTTERLKAAMSSSQPAAVSTPKPIADLLPSLANTVGFIDLADGAVMPSTQATIRVKGPAGAKLALVADGQPIDEHQVGERSVLESRDIVGEEYVGVTLTPGANHLELIATDGFGNVRERVAIDVKVAGRLARIVVEAPAEAKADGHSTVHVLVKLLDAAGLPITARTMVTLVATQGQWVPKDLDPREPGTQVFVEGGSLDAELLTPVDAGKGALRVEVGTVETDAAITFVPDLRPLMAVGLVEGVLNLRSLGSNSIVGADSGDAFEREIRNVSRQWDDGKASAEARGALYLKGKVLGSTLLTVAYDSDKPQGERLFRDIQPDQFYPVYGDSSVKGFDAQSTSRLYVRVDQGTSYVLYGDLTTQSDDPARSLTQYNRSLTGAKGRIDEGPVRVDGFAAYTSSQQVVDELRGNGTSGPYTLSRQNGLVNSEQVHILTRDRNQPAVVIKDVPLTRFADYEIEPYTGRLLFKAPIPSVDADLNPVSIRITYEVDDGGQKFWVGGVDAKVAVTDRANVGAVYLRDTDPSNRSTLRGVNSTIHLADKAVVVGEFAESDSDLYGLGKGRRVEYKQEDENFQARLYGGKTDVSFVNPNALLSQGRSEYGGKVGLKLDDQDRLSIEGIRTEDLVDGGARTGLLARIERSFAGNVKVELGVRHANETVAPAEAASAGTTPINFNSLRTKVTVPVPWLVDGSAYGEYERAIGDGDRQIAALGGSFALPSGGKLYARHEFISTLSGAYDLNSTQRLTTTVIGIDSDYMKDGHVFNEYRVGGGIDARSAEAAIGLRNLWRIADGVNVTTTAENIKPMGGPVTDRSTALTGAIDYTASPDWKGSARAEYRDASIADSWLFTTGGAYKLDERTTLLGKAIYSDIGASSPDSGGHRIARVQLGAAYRPVDSNVWNALARIEVKREQDGTIADTPLDEIATIGSAHLNVSPTSDLSFNARYGIKRATDRSNGLDSHSTTQMLGGRVIKDVSDKWDVGFDAYVLASDGIRSRSYALGGEAGYRVATNLWMSVGYNLSGFKDKDLAGEEYTQRGAYLRMRYKFDENIFESKAKGDGS